MRDKTRAGCSGDGAASLDSRLVPLMHNLIGYHLTGREVYSRQARQNLSGIMHQLEGNGRTSLAGLLTLLLEDMKNGAAVFD